MKRIGKLWTDGKDWFEGNPKDGFTKVNNDERAKEIVDSIRERTVDSGEVVAKPVNLDKKPIDTQPEE